MATITSVSWDGSFLNILGIFPADGSIDIDYSGEFFGSSISYSGGNASIDASTFTPHAAFTLTVNAESGGTSATIHFNSTGVPVEPYVITQGTGGRTMAGTGAGRLFSARVNMKEPNGKVFTLIGNGLDAAGAIGELQAKLAVIDSLVTVVSAVRLSGNLSSGQITAFDAVDAARTTSGIGYDDADITLLQTFNAGTATQVRETPTIRIRDVRNNLRNAGADDGSVDLGNSLVTALAAAYVDADGNTGYVPYKGRFVLS